MDYTIIAQRINKLEKTIADLVTMEATTSGSNPSFSGLNVQKKTILTSNSPGTPGDICWDDNYIYVCVSDNQWKRTPLIFW